MRAEDLLHPTEAGLYCPVGDFYVDPVRPVPRALITHGHADHAGNAHYLQEKYGMQIIAGKGEQEIIATGGHDKSLCPRGFQGWLIQRLIVGPTYRPFIPDVLVDGVLDLRTFGVKGKIVETPGHTPGSITTFIGNSAFVGDLIRGKPTNSDKPDYHIFICDLEDNLKDIEQIASEKGIDAWYLGHLGPLAVEDVQRFIDKKRD